MRRRTVNRFAALVLTAAVFGACSDDGDDATEVTTTTSGGASTTTGSAAASTSAPNTTSPTSTAATSSTAPSTTVTSTTEPTTTSTSAASTTPATTAAPDAGVAACLAGQWDITAVASAGRANTGFDLTGSVQGVRVTVAGRDWTLVADQGVVTAEFGGLSGQLGLQGTASGLVVVSGDRIGFEVVEADGEATLNGEPAPVSFDDLLGALMPSAEGTLACTPPTATITTDTVTVTLAAA